MSKPIPDQFIAEQIGPPQRRFHIVRDDPPTNNQRLAGWAFVYDEMDLDGAWRPGWDTWEEFFFEILRYPPVYATEPLVWRNSMTGEVADLDLLQPFYDGKPVGSTETPEAAGLRLLR